MSRSLAMCTRRKVQQNIQIVVLQLGITYILNDGDLSWCKGNVWNTWRSHWTLSDFQVRPECTDSLLADSLSAEAQLCFPLPVLTRQYLLSGRMAFYSDIHFVLNSAKNIRNCHNESEKNIWANIPKSRIKPDVNLRRSVHVNSVIVGNVRDYC